MIKVLFVCLGNICRSPLAEAIFNHKIKKYGLGGFFMADSCGTANYHIGDRPDHRTIKNALKNGVEIHHVGRQFHRSDLEKFDLILAMDENNLNAILKCANADGLKEKIKLMRMYDSVVGDVPDPYYGTDQDFQEVFDILDRSIEGLIASLQNELKIGKG
jgi:protein-tyrosine phosphatase